MRLPAALLVAALAPLAGCGPVRSTSALIDADVQLQAARTAGAQGAAAYEYAAAEVYLRAAREAEGHAEYESSARYAARAAELARAARERATQGSAPSEAAR